MLIECVDLSKGVVEVALIGWVEGLVCTGVVAVAFFRLRYFLRRHVVAHQHRFRNTLCRIHGLRIRAQHVVVDGLDSR